MIKPENWEQVEAMTGEFHNVTPGGHVCKIMQARAELTQKGKEALVLMFDIEEGKDKGFYADQYNKKVASNPDAKWQGTYMQLTQGTSQSFFKGMITAIEKSNPGYTWNWDENTLRGKLFGAVFGQEEYVGQNDGKTKLSTKCRFIRSVEQIRAGVEVPEIKRLKQTNMSSFGSDVGVNCFPSDEEIPF